MIIKSLSEITPDLISITIDESFHESLNDAIFPENLQEIIINYYTLSLVGVKFPKKLQKLSIFDSQSLIGIQFPEFLQELDLFHNNHSLNKIILPENLYKLTLTNFKYSLVELKFPKNLQILELYDCETSLIGVVFPENLQELYLSYYTCSLIGVVFPEKLRKLSLFEPSHQLDDVNLANIQELVLHIYQFPLNIQFPEYLKRLALYYCKSPLNYDFPHELIIVIDTLIDNAKFEFIKTEDDMYYYTYLKYPRDHFIKTKMNL